MARWPSAVRWYHSTSKVQLELWSCLGQCFFSASWKSFADPTVLLVGMLPKMRLCQQSCPGGSIQGAVRTPRLVPLFSSHQCDKLQVQRCINKSHLPLEEQEWPQSMLKISAPQTQALLGSSFTGLFLQFIWKTEMKFLLQESLSCCLASLLPLLWPYYFASGSREKQVSIYRDWYFVTVTFVFTEIRLDL